MDTREDDEMLGSVGSKIILAFEYEGGSLNLVLVHAAQHANLAAWWLHVDLIQEDEMCRLGSSTVGVISGHGVSLRLISWFRGDVRDVCG